jgi:hypothetical protein
MQVQLRLTRAPRSQAAGHKILSITLSNEEIQRQEADEAWILIP